MTDQERQGKAEQSFTHPERLSRFDNWMQHEIPDWIMWQKKKKKGNEWENCWDSNTIYNLANKIFQY